jgi:hypothetical protein
VNRCATQNQSSSANCKASPTKGLIAALKRRATQNQPSSADREIAV